TLFRSTIAWEAPLQASHRWDVSSGPGTLASSIVTPPFAGSSRTPCSSATLAGSYTATRKRPRVLGCAASLPRIVPGGRLLPRESEPQGSNGHRDTPSTDTKTKRPPARYWTSTGRGSRQPGAQPEAKPMPGLGRVGGRGRRRLFSGAQHLPPSYKKGAALDRFGPVPTPTTRTVTNLLYGGVSN